MSLVISDYLAFINRDLKTLIIALFLLCAFWAGAQVYEKAEEAFAFSKQHRQPIMLVFSGSDWCQSCIRFQQVVLNDSGFLQFARKQIVVLKVDFPQRKKLSPEMISVNESLAERFNPGGEFPKLLLLLPDETVLATLEYKNQSSQDFTEQISNLLGQSGMLKEFSLQEKLMGSAFEFIVVAPDWGTGQLWLNDCVNEVRRIERLLTEFSETSETSAINKGAGKDFVQVSEETFGLVERSLHLSRLTDGAFDISAGLLKKLYKFRGENFSLPEPETMRETLSKTGYKKICLKSPDRILLEIPGMHIGFGAIGKGYAADKVKTLLINKGVTSGVINASGDLTAWGTRPNKEPWRSGIAHPDDPSIMLVWLPVNGYSLATSGNYIQYFENNGVRYSHNIDPLTGMPVKGIKSVTVISPSAELSDALATAVTVMGYKEGLDLVNQLPRTHCLLVDENNKVYRSKNINVEHVG